LAAFALLDNLARRPEYRGRNILGGDGYRTDASFNSSNLDRWNQSRSSGENRYSSFSNRGFYGGDRFGGGGGFRRFGGRF